MEDIEVRLRNQSGIVTNYCYIENQPNTYIGNLLCESPVAARFVKKHMNDTTGYQVFIVNTTKSGSEARTLMHPLAEEVIFTNGERLEFVENSYKSIPYFLFKLIAKADKMQFEDIEIQIRISPKGTCEQRMDIRSEAGEPLEEILSRPEVSRLLAKHCKPELKYCFVHFNAAGKAYKDNKKPYAPVLSHGDIIELVEHSGYDSPLWLTKALQASARNKPEDLFVSDYLHRDTTPEQAKTLNISHQLYIFRDKDKDGWQRVSVPIGEKSGHISPWDDYFVSLPRSMSSGILQLDNFVELHKPICIGFYSESNHTFHPVTVSGEFCHILPMWHPEYKMLYGSLRKGNAYVTATSTIVSTITDFELREDGWNQYEIVKFSNKQSPCSEMRLEEFRKKYRKAGNFYPHFLPSELRKVDSNVWGCRYTNGAHKDHNKTLKELNNMNPSTILFILYEHSQSPIRISYFKDNERWIFHEYEWFTTKNPEPRGSVSTHIKNLLRGEEQELVPIAYIQVRGGIITPIEVPDYYAHTLPAWHPLHCLRVEDVTTDYSYVLKNSPDPEQLFTVIERKGNMVICREKHEDALPFEVPLEKFRKTYYLYADACPMYGIPTPTKEVSKKPTQAPVRWDKGTVFSKVLNQVKCLYKPATMVEWYQ